MINPIDPKRVVISFNGIPVTGFADGTYINITMAEDLYRLVSGADGETTYVKSNNTTAETMITLQQSSLSNDSLMYFHKLDIAANLGGGILSIVDTTGTTVFTANARIAKMPDISYSKDMENREWKFLCENVIYNVGGTI